MVSSGHKSPPCSQPWPEQGCSISCALVPSSSPSSCPSEADLVSLCINYSFAPATSSLHRSAGSFVILPRVGMGEAVGGIGRGGVHSLRRIGTPSALQMPRCTKPELDNPSRASDLMGGETEAQGGEGAG